jgi:hypothetical protein
MLSGGVQFPQKILTSFPEKIEMMKRAAINTGFFLDDGIKTAEEPAAPGGKDKWKRHRIG